VQGSPRDLHLIARRQRQKGIRDRIDSLADIFNQIHKVTSKELLDIANEMFAEDKLSMLTYLPE